MMLLGARVNKLEITCAANFMLMVSKYVDMGFLF